MLAGMNGHRRRVRWEVFLLASCISLPLRAWADSESPEKLRFEKQAQNYTLAPNLDPNGEGESADSEGSAGAAASTRPPDHAPTQTAVTPQQSGIGQETSQEALDDRDITSAEFEDDTLIELKEGLLSIDVQDVPLSQVLTTIAKQGEFRILFVDPAQDPIDIVLNDIPLKKGLEELLKNRDHLFRYNGDTGALSTVAVYARKAGAPPLVGKRRATPKPEEEQAYNQDDFDEPDVTLLSAQALGSLDEDERLEAVEGLADLEDQAEAAEVLTEVLQKDENSDVREAALESIADFDNPDSQRRAASLSIYDSEQDIRMRAVEILTDVEDWDTLRDVAVSHDDPEVRELASDVLEDIDN